MALDKDAAIRFTAVDSKGASSLGSDGDGDPDEGTWLGPWQSVIERSCQLVGSMNLSNG